MSVVLATLLGSVTVTPDDAPRLSGVVRVTDDEPFHISLVVTDRATVAAAERFQQIGYKIEVEISPGQWMTMPDREVANVLTLSESADRIGDTMTLRFAGEKFCPFARAWLRAKRQIKVTAIIGNVANEHEAVVFTGFILQSGFELMPPTAEVQCLDAAAVYAERRALNWSLPPNSGRSRLDIGLELLAIGGIPVKSVSLPNGNGGTVNKPYTLGERTILSWLADFWAILGVELGFEEGALVARGYDPSLPSVAELHAGNISGGSIASPHTLEPNAVGVVAVAFQSIDPSGLLTPPEQITLTTGMYAPQVYATRQVGDVLTPNPSAAEVPALRIISEVITRVTLFGNLDVRTEETTRGWYALRAPGQQIIDIEDPPGYEVTNRAAQVFIYPDGSTRLEPREEYRVLGKTIRAKTLDGQRNVIGTSEEKYFLHFLRKALWTVDVDGADEYLTPGQFQLVNDDGEGVLSDREISGLDSGSSLWGRPDELVETSVVLNDDGTIREEVTIEHAYSIGDSRRRALGAYGYGIDSRTYTGRPAESYVGAVDPWGNTRTITKRYRAVDEDRYVLTEITKNGVQPPVTKTQTLTGALPRPERVEPTSSSQEVRATVADDVRIALAGERIERVEHNEFIETSAEAQFYARVLARKAAAHTISPETIFETNIHKFRMATVSLPRYGIDGLRFCVREVQRDGASSRQTVTADYYPPELG